MSSQDIAQVLKRCQKHYGFKTILTQKDFKILYTTVLGDLPNDEELNFLFNRCNTVEYGQVEDFLKEKFNYTFDTELHILEIFHILDRRGKCFIAVEDLLFACKSVNFPIPMVKMLDYFNEAANEGNIIDYVEFKKMYLSFNKRD